MAYHKNTLSLEKMLLKFLAEPDPCWERAQEGENAC
jgi:hypothetical protein